MTHKPHMTVEREVEAVRERITKISPMISAKCGMTVVKVAIERGNSKCGRAFEWSDKSCVS